MYDGPYSTSKLLLSHSGSNQSLTSVRSSQNELYIEYPSYHLKKNKIQIYFTSVRDSITVFQPLHLIFFVLFRCPQQANCMFQVRTLYLWSQFDLIVLHSLLNLRSRIGCGGYIYGHGIISSSSNPDIDSKGMTDGCVWYVEAQQTNGSVILKRIFDPSDLENKKKDSMPAMTVQYSIFVHQSPWSWWFPYRHRFTTVGVLPDSCCTKLRYRAINRSSSRLARKSWFISGHQKAVIYRYFKKRNVFIGIFQAYVEASIQLRDSN